MRILLTAVGLLIPHLVCKKHGDNHEASVKSAAACTVQAGGRTYLQPSPGGAATPNNLDQGDVVVVRKDSNGFKCVEWSGNGMFLTGYVPATALAGACGAVGGATGGYCSDQAVPVSPAPAPAPSAASSLLFGYNIHDAATQDYYSSRLGPGQLPYKSGKPAYMLQVAFAESASGGPGAWHLPSV